MAKKAVQEDATPTAEQKEQAPDTFPQPEDGQLLEADAGQDAMPDVAQQAAQGIPAAVAPPASAQPAVSPVPQVPPPPGGVRRSAPTADVARPTVGQAIGRALGWLLRLLLIVLLGVAVGVLLYLTVPSLFARIVQPIARSNAAVDRLETAVVTLEAEVDDLRIEQGQTANEMQSALLDSQEAVAGRLAAAEERLAAAEARLRDAEDALAAQAGRVEDLEDALSETLDQLDALTEQLDALEAELPGAAEYAEYNRQLLLIRAWQDVLKARLRLMENNAGLAGEDLARAVETMERLYVASSAEQQAALDPIAARLQSALESIRSNPFAANNDLEIAWYELGQLIEPVSIPALPGMSPTPTPAEGTPTPTGTPTAAPTPTAGTGTPGPATGTPAPAMPTPTP